MDVLKGLTLLLLCQSAGEGLARLLDLPLPGPVLGLLLLAGLLQWAPLRAPVQAAATPLLSHLSLLFVPVGVGVVAHLTLVAQYGPRMLLAVVVSTWIGLAVTVLVLRALWPRGPAALAVQTGAASGPEGASSRSPDRSPDPSSVPSPIPSPGSASGTPRRPRRR